METPRTTTEEITHPTGLVEFRLYLTPEEAPLVASDVRGFFTELDAAVHALVQLRSGKWDQVIESPYDEGNPGARQRQAMDWTIYSLENHFIPKLKGIRTAALRAYRGHGASWAKLAAAMGLSARSTAKSRWERLTQADPSDWERWARHGRRPHS